MSANCQTLREATGITDDHRRGNDAYRRLCQRVTRYTLHGTDEQANRADEAARRFAHAESHRGNIDPLLDRLCRALGLPDPLLTDR